MIRHFTLGGLLAAGALLSTPSTSHACGGCFAPVGSPSVVTAHRIAIAANDEETMLWDQFEYRGQPEDFVWVLPVPGSQEVDVELASNAFFTALQEESAITLQGPFVGGGGGSSRGGIGCGEAAGFAADGSAAEDREVIIYNEEVVGPYETVVIGSESEDSLISWLRDAGYAIPDELMPIIAWYIERESSFLVLRLSPGEGIQRMQPVRVSWPAGTPTLPLRMIAAGVAGAVSLELFVLGDQRYAAANFANGEIDRDELSVDLATNVFNYDDLAAQALAEDGGRVWLTEFAAPALNLAGRVEWNVALAEASDDIAVVERLLGTTPYLTRMRAELPVALLDDDLILRRSDGAMLPGFIQVNRTHSGSSASLERDADEAFAGPLGLAWPIGAAALFVLGRRRRRRQP